MKFTIKINLIFASILFSVLQSNAQEKTNRVLIFSKTAGYHHASIPAGIAAIMKLGIQDHFLVDTTTNSNYFCDDSLKHYSAVIFLSPSGNILDTAQKTDFKRFIEAGGGFMGIHAASTPEKAWTWYGHLVGAVFVNHPEPQTGNVIVADHQNNATKHLPEQFSWKDEWYNFRDIQPDLHVLLQADESSYKGGTNGKDHPLAWYHEYDGGRSFYTALGHFDEAYTNPLFIKHIEAGILYAIGDNITVDYSNVKTASLK